MTKNETYKYTKNSSEEQQVHIIKNGNNTINMNNDNTEEMTENDIKYGRQVNANFYDFLKKHKIEGDKVAYTHTCFGPPFGKYFINDDLDYETFLVLYKRLVEYGESDHGGLYITEKQKNVGPIYVDYDFRFNEKNRQYSIKNIKKITQVYLDLIAKYLDIKNSSHDLKAYVTEKAVPTYDEKNQNYKDGFHIIFPIPVDVKIRFLIHEQAKEIILNSDILSNIPYINKNVDEIIDESVVMRNGWLMYGSKKYKKKNYMLTHIYDENMNELDKSTYSKDELVVLFCARKYDENDALPLKAEFITSEMKESINKIYNKYNGSKKIQNNIIKQEKINNLIQPMKFSNTNEVLLAKKLIKLLSEKRADKYMDWAPVGWALYNISPELYNEFIDFSKKCVHKFNENDCTKFWNNIKSGSYTIASLHYWAKQDSPEEYNELILDNISKLIENAEMGNNDDLAKVLYELYKYEYKCVSKTKNKWYAFYDNRWHYVDQAYTLSNIISDEIAVIYGKRAIAYFNKATYNQGGDRDNSTKKGTELLKIVDKLKTESFKNAVIASAANRFIDEKFEEKLDSNPNLIGFDNGVYDLERGIFRKGIPEDYMTMSTNYNYKNDYNINSKEILEILKYFSQVMTEDNMKEYTLLSFASFLDGHIKQQIFRVYTGSGGNGKSQTMDLIKAVMGQYFGVLPTGILTRKRGGSSNATPELADKRGKRYLIIQEPEHDDQVYVGQMKNFTGGDTIPARALYGDPFEYKPQFKLGLVCNKLPNIPANDGGTWRRLKVIPFESEFVDKINSRSTRKQFIKDTSLPEKMKNWAQPFMWLLLNVYYKKYRENNYIIDEPAKVTQFTKQYQITSDKYQEFISEILVETDDESDSITIVSLYSIFKSWHNEAGYGRSNIPTRNEFINYFKSNKSYPIDCGSFIGIVYREDYDKRDKDDKIDKKKISKNKLNNNSDSDNDSDSKNNKHVNNKNKSDSDNDSINSNKNRHNKNNINSSDSDSDSDSDSNSDNESMSLVIN
jgi:P4 family phage/plasmid primase-like protien